ncbi:MAG: hypothetical protein ABI353_18390 [Isosphaeraceae bacterium]
MKDYLVSFDRNQNPVLVVAVTTESATADDLIELNHRLQSVVPSIPFGMVVDPEVIRVVKLGHDGLVPNPVELVTREMLGPYDPDFAGQDTEYGTKQGFLIYFKGRVESWLWDLADRWKLDQPPGMRELAAITLLDRLRGGNTSDEVAVRGSIIP